RECGKSCKCLRRSDHAGALVRRGFAAPKRHSTSVVCTTKRERTTKGTMRITKRHKKPLGKTLLCAFSAMTAPDSIGPDAVASIDCDDCAFRAIHSVRNVL